MRRRVRKTERERLNFNAPLSLLGLLSGSECLAAKKVYAVLKKSTSSRLISRKRKGTGIFTQNILLEGANHV